MLIVAAHFFRYSETGRKPMLKTPLPARQKLILYDVSWDEYTRHLRNFERRHLHLTYDRGTLEIMTLSFEHEWIGRFLGRIVVTLTEELNLPIKQGGSTTIRRRKKKKGLESDNCYWISHEADVRNNKVIDLRKDPPPDLALEVDVSRSSMNRMGIYASLNVPEVWRWSKDGLAFLRLKEDGQYESVATSPTFLLAITPADLMSFVGMRSQMDENAVIRQFRAWIHGKLAGGQVSPP
jgi:Uma2 family endonuclease